MKVLLLLLIAALVVSACSELRPVERKWMSRPAQKSAYSAMLIEDTYNAGESNEYHLRLDTAPAGDDGWFFKDDLDTGLIISPKPGLRWTSPTDLLVTVHTAEIEGKTRQALGGNHHPVGSLTVRYIADQPKQ
ncbi:hypothetical protein [Sphingomonas sp. UYP23]